MKTQAWRTLLVPFVPVYASVIAAKSRLFERGLLSGRRLAHPVLSVGSLSAGGAGKTPVVLMLGRLLQAREFNLCVLTRGYRRSSTRIERVDPQGEPSCFGDEPLLLAQRLAPASVYAGADRHKAGRLAELDRPCGKKSIYLLDDGFQHRKLVRDLDIVLLTRQELNDRMLPAGNLREPLSALRRADVIVVREDEPEVTEWLAAKMPQIRAKVWVIQRQLRFPQGRTGLKRPVVFCGIARPETFAAMLAAEGITTVATATFRDHHPYSVRDVEALLKIALANRADGFLTTEKDAVKLTAPMMERLSSAGPVVIPELHVKLIDEASKLDELLTLLTAKRAEHP